MSLNSIVVQGTLKPDGTLELDEKPALTPGRVHVMLQPASASAEPKGGLAETIAEIRQNQQVCAYMGRTSEEIACDEDQRRTDEDAYEQRMQEIWSQTKTGASAGGS